jgi:hypothetical protein
MGYFYVKTKTQCYKIEADYLKLDQREHGDVIFLKKEIPDKINPEDGTNAWDVAFINTKDAEIVGLDRFVTRDPIPSSKKQLTTDILKALLFVALGYLLNRRTLKT